MGLRLRKATFRLGYAASLVMLGCGPKVNVATNPFDEDLHANAKEYERPASAPPSTAAPRTKLREGKIKRSALLAVLDAGPAAFLHDIDMVALHDEQNFHGWQLKQITSPSSPAALTGSGMSKRTRTTSIITAPSRRSTSRWAASAPS